MAGGIRECYKDNLDATMAGSLPLSRTATGLAIAEPSTVVTAAKTILLVPSPFISAVTLDTKSQITFQVGMGKRHYSARYREQNRIE